MLPAKLGDGCELRLFEEADAEELFAVIARNREYLSEWMPWPAGQTLQHTLQFIRASREQAAADNGFQAAIVCEGRIAGVIGFHAINWVNRSASIGYWLVEEQQGRGTMTRAVRALVDYAFSERELNRVEIRAAPGNARSRAIPERLGFREEGTLREAERLGDGYVDNVVYAVLAAEWDAK